MGRNTDAFAFLLVRVSFHPWGNLLDPAHKLRMSSEPHLEYELQLSRQGYRLIAGVDEAGRGALAGPVVAAAVILPLASPAELLATLREVRDSKVLTPAHRERLFELIHRVALAVGVAAVSPRLIDVLGIAPASRLAMRNAVQRLTLPPDFLLVDGFPLPLLAAPQRAIVRGDRQCLSIAAASIIAKVSRDRMMVALDARYPGYGLARHKGYGTQAHRAALIERGPTPVHRFSYAPVRQAAMHQVGAGRAPSISPNDAARG